MTSNRQGHIRKWLKIAQNAGNRVKTNTFYATMSLIHDQLQCNLVDVLFAMTYIPQDLKYLVKVISRSKVKVKYCNFQWNMTKNQAYRAIHPEKCHQLLSDFACSYWSLYSVVRSQGLLKVKRSRSNCPFSLNFDQNRHCVLYQMEQLQYFSIISHMLLVKKTRSLYQPIEIQEKGHLLPWKYNPFTVL